ncbi:MAG TPA: isocitrate/isopropylmalate dehydrogenase family protein [Gammaproteobacteria bacterium]|nr:isocitrate/isopropylmalate dehydrogenase family protein [Gammaproteobacteria bacterium]
MSNGNEFRIAVLPGDGIGIEVMDACLEVLEVLAGRTSAYKLKMDHLPAGAGHYRDTGTALPQKTLDAARGADAILFGAMGLPQVRTEAGTEIQPQLDLRVALDLYAGVRPIKAIPGAPTPLADPRAAEIDLIIVREQTEGLFSDVGKARKKNDAVVVDRMVISRKGSERVTEFAFKLAERRRRDGRPGRVTCVDKANVLASAAFFRKVFNERAALHPEIETDCMYVDAASLNLVRAPWQFDVLVTENMFGDILSDLCAGLIGGMGLAPSGDMGDDHGLFQPCHGTAPDIAGKDLANPTAMLLSAVLMLQWLWHRHGVVALREAAHLLENAIYRGYAEGAIRPAEYGGSDGTQAVGRKVAELIRAS